MSELRRTSGRSSVPKEGIYLDATLAVVEQQVDERIDAIVNLRRRATRLTIGTLLATTLAGGAMTAAALTYLPPETMPAPSPVVLVELHCVEGEDASAPAFFTARYKVTAAGESRTDPVDVCWGAHTMLAEGADLTTANPAELLRIADEVVTSAQSEPAEHTAPAEPEVSEASFGSLRLPGVSDLGACERAADGRIVVMALANSAGADWAELCSRTDGYRLAGAGG